MTAIFKDMVKAYAEQIIGTPYQFPSYHIGGAVQVATRYNTC